MKKYLRAVICVTFTFIKFCFIKLFHGNRFNFHLVELLSPLTEVDISRRGKLFIGDVVKARSGSKIRVRNNGTMSIGKNTSLNHGCIFTCYEKIVIGEDVQFGPNVLIYDHDHDFRVENGLKKLKYKAAPVEIGNNVWIGANTVILRGTKIGDNCVVGAGSVIKGEYEDNSIIIQKRDTEVVKYILNN
jgi:acetyltransferase-like isoleucine patch superfamily enzyme